MKAFNALLVSLFHSITFGLFRPCTLEGSCPGGPDSVAEAHTDTDAPGHSANAQSVAQEPSEAEKLVVQHYAAHSSPSTEAIVMTNSAARRILADLTKVFTPPVIVPGCQMDMLQMKAGEQRVIDYITRQIDKGRY